MNAAEDSTLLHLKYDYLFLLLEMPVLCLLYTILFFSLRDNDITDIGVNSLAVWLTCNSTLKTLE
jgi:hypothetical protein